MANTAEPQVIPTEPPILNGLRDHLARNISPTQLARARAAFEQIGFAKVGFLAPSSVKANMRSEAETLITHHGIRRDLTLSATGHTARRMRNVRRREINKYSTAVPAVYSCTELRGMLGQITGEAVLECPYQPEQYVITELSADGDTHGWHWDDYSFALVWIIECPPLADGGFVQCVPHTTWNKADPQLHRQFIDNPIYSHELLPGDLYLMRTDTGLHRVYPIRSGRRLIINMAYASQTDLNKQISHETMDTLWAERCSPDRATRPLSGPGD